MKLTMLGTGNALVTECYNTCFVIEDHDKYFMVDGGGGSTVLHQLKYAGINWKNIHNIFVTHKHIDHIMGIVWVMRIVCQNMQSDIFKGDLNIYGHDEVISLLDELAHKLLNKKETKYIGERLHLITVEDGEKCLINGREVTFFDIGSTKAKQFGFCMMMDDEKKLTCCGDEPYNSCEEQYAAKSEWLLHEAFCLFEEADQFHPYEKHHSTVKDAAELAEKLGVKNLILYHTEDKNIRKRKELYSEEGRKYFKGNLFVPDDLETIVL